MIKQILVSQSHGTFPAKFKSWKFPAGEIGFKLENPNDFLATMDVTIKSRLNDSDSIMELIFAVDAIRQINKDIRISLLVPVVPYARQDRICVEGESFSLRVFANLINSLNFSLVNCYEPHSKVSNDLIKNLNPINLNRRIFDTLNGNWGANSMFVSPDKGAVNRVKQLNKLFGNYPIAVADKVRDLSNGNIIGMELDGNVEGKNVYIFDDLLQGGATFIELHKLLKKYGAKKTTLIVVHGIFSKGFECVTDIYDQVITTNTYQDFGRDSIPKNMMVLPIY